jgi:hypothetical protein
MGVDRRLKIVFSDFFSILLEEFCEISAKVAKEPEATCR